VQVSDTCLTPAGLLIVLLLALAALLIDRFLLRSE
jgi:hypothetical protein